MKYILDKLPGNEKIAEKLGNAEEQNAILERYGKCKIVFSYAREDWPFVEAVAKALKIYFPQSDTFNVEHGEFRRDLPNVFYYTNNGIPFQWVHKVKDESREKHENRNKVAANDCYYQILGQANVFIVFTYQNKIKDGTEGIAGAGCWQTGELTNWIKTNVANPRFQFKIDLGKANDALRRHKPKWELFNPAPLEFELISADAYDLACAKKIAERIIRKLLFNQSPIFFPNISTVFSYEKDIIQLYQEIPLIISNWRIRPNDENATNLILKLLAYIKQGVPPFWPSVVRQADFKKASPNPLSNDKTDEIGGPRTGLNMLWPEDSSDFDDESQEEGMPDMVIAAALSKYHQKENCKSCMLEENLSFPEAGPRRFIYSTRVNIVAIVVSGGIAPGINAVIDGIVRRHKKYNENVKILGINNGFYTLSQWNWDVIEELDIKATSAKVTEGGSCLQTCRQKDLLPSSENQIENVENIVTTLIAKNIKILYVIGGDGSMRATHQIAQACRIREQGPGNDSKISVIGIPKTMDNDILWVWQTFGFATAVEKAREIIEYLATEVKANPRICVLQLFGSASGFVVSHAVLASPTNTCDFALIPEANFSINMLAWKLAVRMVADEKPRIIPYGLIVMAESAIPNSDDCGTYRELVGLTVKESNELTRFLEYRSENPKSFPDGQISNDLRSAGLKLVSEGIRIRMIEIFSDKDLMTKIATEIGKPLPRIEVEDDERFRFFTNEPRHLLRSVPPSFSDVIMGSRLGALAVDNAMAGYTDFMISQWLTEFVMVPLDLVALGRKHIPQDGIFWKSVLAKTGQGDLS